MAFHGASRDRVGHGMSTKGSNHHGPMGGRAVGKAKFRRKGRG